MSEMFGEIILGLMLFITIVTLIFGFYAIWQFANTSEEYAKAGLSIFDFQNRPDKK